MARKRMIHPGFWDDKKIAKLSHTARLTYIGLSTFAEDSGVGHADPEFLKSKLFCYDRMSITKLKKIYNEIVDKKLITHFTEDDEEYYYVNNFDTYQTISHKTPYTLPLPPNHPEYKTPESFRNDSGIAPESLQKNAPQYNINKLNIISNINKNKFGSHQNVLLTEEEWNELKNTFGFAGAGTMIEKLSSYMFRTGKEYPDHFRVIKDWAPKNSITPVNPDLVAWEQQGFKSLEEEYETERS